MKLTMLIAPLLLLASATLSASPLPDFPFINVTGEARMEVEPDKANIQFTVRSTAATADAATSTVYQQGRELLAFLNEQGITEQDIDASQINKDALYKDYNDRSITGYEATQPIRVTLNSLQAYADVMDYLFRQQHIFSIRSSFDTSKREQFEQELTIKAGAHATSQATNLAKALGVKLGAVQGISEAGGFNTLHNEFGFADSAVSFGALRKSSAESSSLVLPRHINLQRSVNVIYRIKN
ncbi:SIMPL domain-containing protein [Chromatiaceae bacterium AAb-1]|nr:SIMPL domain-containing protein [Chromatiaceae bacterium AAb-1]